MSEPDAHPLVALAATMERLRRECAWKAQQTHASLGRYLLEEAHETLEAIEGGDAEHLREELGDLLLQVYFHAAIAAERGDYDIADVARDLDAKLHRRNPHVFGPGAGGSGGETDAHAINEQWESIKRAEKQRSHPAEGLPTTLPALLYADKVIDRVQRAGGSVEAPEEEPGGPADDLADDPAADLGRRLWALAREAHAAGIDAEQALRAITRRVADG